MNTNPPDFPRQSFPKVIWLFLALCPTIPIAFGTAKGGSDQLMQIIGFVATPLVTIFCCHELLRTDRAFSVGRVFGAILLGGFVAVFDIAGGFFAGCALGGVKI